MPKKDASKKTLNVLFTFQLYDPRRIPESVSFVFLNCVRVCMRVRMRVRMASRARVRGMC